jgi:hypothetical protein
MGTVWPTASGSGNTTQWSTSSPVLCTRETGEVRVQGVGVRLEDLARLSERAHEREKERERERESTTVVRDTVQHFDRGALLFLAVIKKSRWIESMKSLAYPSS